MGAVSAVTLWGVSGRTRVHLGGGFEGNGTDFSVLWTELPLVAVAGAVLPVVGLVLGLRLLRVLRRPGRTGSEFDQ
ncbi:hypothetical protein [Streptomyces sp. NPDC002851]